jgi:hypothetical protein
MATVRPVAIAMRRKDGTGQASIPSWASSIAAIFLLLHQDVPELIEQPEDVHVFISRLCRLGLGGA